MAPPADPDALSPAELKALVIELLGKVADLERTVVAQHAEIARLKDLKGRPPIKPSGMEQASELKPRRGSRGRRGRGKVVPRVVVEERVIRARVPPGSRFRGYQDFLVQDLVLRTEAVRYRRERWLTPEGQLVVAPLPGGVDDHFGGHDAKVLQVSGCEKGPEIQGLPDRSVVPAMPESEPGSRTD